jgi:hypothetical protein
MLILARHPPIHAACAKPLRAALCVRAASPCQMIWICDYTSRRDEESLGSCVVDLAPRALEPRPALSRRDTGDTGHATRTRTTHSRVTRHTTAGERPTRVRPATATPQVATRTVVHGAVSAVCVRHVCACLWVAGGVGLRAGVSTERTVTTDTQDAADARGPHRGARRTGDTWETAQRTHSAQRGRALRSRSGPMA